jgi:ABC-type transport system involved in multi-copper enzyme maturation permease subunit
MTRIALVWHILKKDLRLLRWVLPVWLLFSLLDTINRVVSPALIVDDQRWLVTLPMWIFLISLAYSLQLLLVVANHIQAERLVGTTAFWLTRPIPRGALLLSKLLGLALFVLLPALAFETVMMVMYHVPAATIVAAWLQQAGAMSLLVLLVMFAATLTSTPTRMLILIVCTIVGLYVAFLVWVSLSMVRSSTTTSLGSVGFEPHFNASDPTVFLVALIALGLVLLGAIILQYLRRRAAIAVGIVFFGVYATMAVAALAENTHLSLFGGFPTVANEPWARDPSITKLRLRPGKRLRGEQRVSDNVGHLTQRMMTWVAAPVVLDGLPPNYTVDVFTLSAQVRFPDGHTVQSERAPSQQTAEPIPVPGGPIPSTPWKPESWPTLFMVPSDAAKQYGDRPGVYTGTFIYYLRRHDSLAKTPLAEGVGYQDGARSLRIATLRPDIDACAVTYSISRVNLMSNALTQTYLTALFRRRDGVELFDRYGGFGNYGMYSGLSFSSIRAGSLGFFPTPHPLEVFDLDYRLARPSYDYRRGEGPACDQMTVEIERSSFAGTLTRTLELTDFRMNEGEPRELFGR